MSGKTVNRKLGGWLKRVVQNHLYIVWFMVPFKDASRSFMTLTSAGRPLSRAFSRAGRIFSFRHGQVETGTTHGFSKLSQSTHHQDITNVSTLPAVIDTWP